MDGCRIFFQDMQLSQTIQYRHWVHGLHPTTTNLIGKLCGERLQVVLLYTLWYGWYVNGGDISYGRLNKIPFQEIQWYHAMAALLLILTRIGVPVSTSSF